MPAVLWSVTVSASHTKEAQIDRAATKPHCSRFTAPFQAVTAERRLISRCRRRSFHSLGDTTEVGEKEGVLLRLWPWPAIALAAMPVLAMVASMLKCLSKPKHSPPCRVPDVAQSPVPLLGCTITWTV